MTPAGNQRLKTRAKTSAGRIRALRRAIGLDRPTAKKCCRPRQIGEGMIPTSFYAQVHPIVVAHNTIKPDGTLPTLDEAREMVARMPRVVGLPVIR